MSYLPPDAMAIRLNVSFPISAGVNGTVAFLLTAHPNSIVALSACSSTPIARVGPLSSSSLAIVLGP